MILSLFGVLIGISLIFIIIGLVRQESVMALIGFVFLFLLSFVLLNGTLEYDKGANITNTYSYDGAGNMNGSIQYVAYSREAFDDSSSHTMGYYLVILSFVGFVGVLLGLKSTWKRESDRKAVEDGYEK